MAITSLDMAKRIPKVESDRDQWVEDAWKASCREFLELLSEWQMAHYSIQDKRKKVVI